MASFDKRLAALEGGYTAPQLASIVLAREADPTAWLLSDGGDQAEKSAVMSFILDAVDGRSKGLPSEIGRV
ncbi:MAG: hypothetical protein C0494_15925 [Sphingobium sp.]|nr:hypothetical protein [Sphingobium sp.]